MKESIRWKLMLYVACVVAVTAGALSLVSYEFARNTLRRQIHQRLSVVVSDRQKLLLTFIQQQQERVSLVASRTRLRQLLEQFTAGQIPEQVFRQESRQILEDAQRSSDGCWAIWLTDASGRVVAATEDSYLGRDEANLPEFLEGRTSAQLQVIRSANGHYQAVLSAPARIGPDRLVGVVMMLVDAEPVMRVLADRTGLGATGALMIGHRVGDKIRYLLMGDSGTQTVEVSAPESPAMAAATESQSGFEQTRDWRGHQVLAAYRPAGYRDWGIVTKMDVAEAYAPIVQLRDMFISIELLALVLGLVVAYVLAGRFAEPLLRMVSAVESITSGGRHAHVPVESRDEVGRLAAAFNKMSEELAHSYALLEERVKARTAELEAERDLLQQLMDHSPDRIYFKDRQSRFIRVNRALAKFFGFDDPQQVLGKTDFDVFGREHAQQAFDDEQRIIRTGQPAVSLEERETWRDGHITWCSTTKSPLRDVSGEIIGTFGISRDITDRKRAEEQLNRYFMLSPDLFCIADYRGYFRRLNSAWSVVLGYTDEELRAQPFLSFVHPDDREATQREFSQNLQSRRTMQFENRYRCKDGTYRWLQWNAIPVPEEQIIHAVARDVTADKHAQELVASYADALNHKNQEMEDDLRMAREVHQIFIPQTHPVFPRDATPQTSALQFSHRYFPTSALGGDFFDILSLSDTRAGVLICDVMGHGMRAALVTSIIRGLMDKNRDFAEEPGQFLAKINQALLTDLRKCSTTIFATAAYVVIDAATGQAQYANAGHPSPFWLRRSKKALELFEEQTLPSAGALGLFQDLTYPVAAHTLDVGDSLLFFTDGLYEVDDRNGEQFGFERLREAVRRRLNRPAEQLLDELLLETRQHADRGDFTDDVCLVEVELAAKMAAGQSR
jgi:sigma-B regulation protein RsbU (phosphoserine phosphatase)